MPSDIHLLTRTEVTPGKPTEYVGYCRARGVDHKQFRDPSAKGFRVSDITCEGCRKPFERKEHKPSLFEI